MANEIQEFLKWFDEQYAFLESRQRDPVLGAQDGGIIVDDANEYARKVGAGHLSVEPNWDQGMPYCSTDNAKSILGRMGLWCREQLQEQELQKELQQERHQPDGDGPYSVREASIITRISKRKIYQDCRDGKIQHSKNPIRITNDALEQYQQERERIPLKTSGFRNL